ncbi:MULTISPECIES: zinc ribbon domain-containing protein [unclassified Stygiolobus]|uniref:zinc ribbon domain-containing protein n=1 Tax=unclassified Stygiolobus TaxID=2824672 RepID=UPI00307CD97F
MVKVCKACGYQNPDNAIYCIRCGAPLENIAQQQTQYPYQQPLQYPNPTPAGQFINRSAGIWFLVSGIIGIIAGIIETTLINSQGNISVVAAFVTLVLIYALILIGNVGFKKLNSRRLGRAINRAFFSGIMLTILISLGVMAGLAKPQPETVVVNTPFGSYVTTTYVSYANIAPAGGVLAFVSFIFIIAFMLMFMYSSGLIYVGAKNRLWMLLAGGIIFLMSTIGILISMITFLMGKPIYVFGSYGNEITLMLYGVLMIVSYVVDFNLRR